MGQIQLSIGTTPGQSGPGSNGNEGVLCIFLTPVLLEPLHQIVSCHKQDIHLVSLTSLQRCSWCLLQPQLSGLDFQFKIQENIQQLGMRSTEGIAFVQSCALSKVAVHLSWFKVWDFKSFNASVSILSRGCPHGVMVKAKDCGIVVREFVLQSRYYVHFRTNTLGKGMNPLILPAMS